MKTAQEIGFLGFGEAARAFHASLAPVLPDWQFRSYDIKLDGTSERQAMVGAMEAAKVVTEFRPQGLAGVRYLFSAVTADQSLVALQPVLPVLEQGTCVIDINSVSPGRKLETARLVESGGAEYLDMAVMAPVIPDGHRTPVLVAGHCLQAFAGFLKRADFRWRKAGDVPGAATAIKMVRSVFVKGLEAITVETLLAAERLGCRPEILQSISGSYPGLGWPDSAAYAFERTLTHGRRRAAEMEECAATLREIGLRDDLAKAIARVQADQGLAGAIGAATGSLESILPEVSKRRSRPPSNTVEINPDRDAPGPRGRSSG